MEICSFTKNILKNYTGITEQNFILMSPCDVNGENAHPVFQYLRYNSQLFDEKSKKIDLISWNFGKFLLDREGLVVKYYSPKDTLSQMDIENVLQGQVRGHSPRDPQTGKMITINQNLTSNQTMPQKQQPGWNMNQPQVQGM